MGKHTGGNVLPFASELLHAKPTRQSFESIHDSKQVKLPPLSNEMHSPRRPPAVIGQLAELVQLLVQTPAATSSTWMVKQPCTVETQVSALGLHSL
jgi:hypothetical protein